MTKILKTYEELKSNVGKKVKVKRALTNEIFEGILSSTVCDNVDYIEIIVEKNYYGLTDQNYKIYSIWQSIELIEEDNNNEKNMTKYIDTTDLKACEEANRKVLYNNKLIIEEIIWNDCSSLVNQWQLVKDVIDNIHKINPVIKSIGYVLFEDDKFLILGNSVDKEDLTVDGACVNGGMKIYKPQIIKRSVI